MQWASWRNVIVVLLHFVQTGQCGIAPLLLRGLDGENKGQPMSGSCDGAGKGKGSSLESRVELPPSWGVLEQGSSYSFLQLGGSISAAIDTHVKLIAWRYFGIRCYVLISLCCDYPSFFTAIQTTLNLFAKCLQWWILNIGSSRCKTLPKEHEWCGAVLHLLPILSCVIWCFLLRSIRAQVSLTQSLVCSIYTHQWGWIQTNLTASRIWIDTVSSRALSMLLFTFLPSKLNLNFKLEL